MYELHERILKTFEQIKKEADTKQICKRKGVGAAILEIETYEDFTTDAKINLFTAINGPSGPKNECSNVVGACGCSHAEPRVIMKYLRLTNSHDVFAPEGKKKILLSTYSPCVPCANLAIDSGIIDMFIYEIWTPHWNQRHFHADAALGNSDIVYWSIQQLKSDQGREKLQEWLEAV